MPEVFDEISQPVARKLRILVAPLDWGLGHATRCIPLVKELIAQGCEPWLAGNQGQEILFKAEFPELPFIPLEGYRAKYSRSKIGMLWQMLVQSPKFLQVIKKEHEWLKQMVDRYAFNAVISDNRFGLCHPLIPSIFITHQLHIKSPLGKWSEKFLQKRNYRYIDRFTECWVPDQWQNSLAGELSHPVQPPAIPLRYIGLLSRFSPSTGDTTIKDHLLFILSGPEPQRSILENKIVEQVSRYNGTATIVRGLPGNHSLIPSTNMIRFYNHLPAKDLVDEINKAEFVISRCGYSTVMDMMTLAKKTILVSTPGQTEQEYLADYLATRQLALCFEQKDFSLDQAIKQARQFTYRLQDFSVNNMLPNVVSDLVHSIK